MGKIRIGDERHRFRTPVGERSKTKQSFTDSCDINKIVARHRKTGIWDSLAKRQPTYGDFSAAEDLHTAMNMTMAAQESFDALPSAVRNLCNNDPRRLLEALANEEETTALYDAGLPMAEGYKPYRPEEQKDDPPASEGNQAVDSSEGEKPQT